MEMDYDDDDFYYDDDYLYVEDTFAAADELAETSVPSPPAYDRIDDDYEGYDYYDYWMDTEYGTDEYYDVRIPRTDDTRWQAGQKRKLGHATESPRPGKKQKMGPKSKIDKKGSTVSETKKIWRGPNVVYMSFQDAHVLELSYRDRRESKDYALLPDWRQKFPQAQNKGSRDDAPNVLDKAQADQDQEEGDWEDEDKDDDGEEDGNGQGLDPAVLMSILQNKLGESGMGEDGRQLQEMIAQMLSSGGGSMEELLENLTASVLEQVDEGGADSGMGKWLSQQGVNVQDEDEEEEEDEEQAEEDINKGQNKALLDGRGTKTNGTTTKSTNGQVSEKAPDPIKGSSKEESRSAGQPTSTGSKRQRKQKPTAQPSMDADDDQKQSSATKVEQDQPPAKPTRGTKRKAAVDSVEQEPKKQPRAGYAAATKSSQNRSEQMEKRPTRSTRQRK